MGKSQAEESPKTSTTGSKRKATRSVNNLTPQQLQRKRANDREAQRAIRARTKNRIETLEKELDDLKKSVQRDTLVKDLMAKIALLERELDGYRGEEGGHPRSRPIPYPHHPPGFDGTYSGSSSSRESFENPHSFESTPLSGDYPPGYTMHHPIGIDGVNGVNPALGFAQQAPSPVASSPVSSAAATDDNSHYIPTSAPAIMDGQVIPPTSAPLLKQPDGLHYGRESPYTRMPQPHSIHGSPYVQPQSWQPYQFANGHYSH